MIPELSEAQLNALNSKAEAKVYREFRDHLSAEYVVFFQVGWILRREDENARDGEADFLVCHPEKGYLCIEVKGGGISFDAKIGEWASIDRYGEKHSIKDPVKQALHEKYSVLTKLNENARWRDLRIANVSRGHAVFFPDVGTKRSLVKTDLPEQLIGDVDDLASPQSWVEGIFDYWRNCEKSQIAMGTRGLAVVREVFSRSFEVRPLLSTYFQEEEQRRIVLTADQARVLDLLRSRRRVAISGGAGTGKTLIAVEKARRLAADGFRTLLTCFNRQLADHLAELCKSVSGLEVMSFHQLCHRFVERAKQVSGQDLLDEARKAYPGKDLFLVHYPNALAYALDVVEDRYDAIVCDEGQDFAEDFWMPIEMLLTDYEKSPIYIFFDDNQNLYSRASSFPIKDEPFALTTNCRNTKTIHEAAYRFYRGEEVAPPGIEGEPITVIEAPSFKSQATKIHAKIVDLITRDRIPAGDIVVLILSNDQKTDYYEAIRHLPLPTPNKWLEEGWQTKETILLDTVARFKGLEAPIVFLWGLDGMSIEKNREQLYVGLSRAKSLLLVCGTPEICRAILASRS
jgi:hypothetical protein